MRIGLDVQLLWMDCAGLHYYVRHLLDWLCRLAHPNRIMPFLYGPPGMPHAEVVRSLSHALGAGEVSHYWDLPNIVLLSNCIGGAGRLPKLLKQIDRKIVLPLWRKLIDLRVTRPNGSGRMPRLWRRRPPSRAVDLIHHVGVQVLPLHEKTNVMTIPDLTTRRVPQCHEYHTIQWYEEAYRGATRMDLLLTYSEHTKRDVVECLGVDEAMVRVTPLAAHPQYTLIKDRDRVQDVVAKYGLTGRPYIITVGTLEPRKNLCRLVEAFHRAKQRDVSLGHQLVLVGARGWMWEPIFEAVERLGLQSQVRWLDYVPFDDLPALLNGADLLVYPSLYEGFGLPPLEAMSCGTPVITSNISSLPEVVGDAGLLVDPYQVEDLEEAMYRALTDPGLRSSLSEKGLARARLFSWERTARLTLDAYGEAIRRSQRNGRRRPEKETRTRCYEEIRAGILQQLFQQALDSLNA